MDTHQAYNTLRGSGPLKSTMDVIWAAQVTIVTVSVINNWCVPATPKDGARSFYHLLSDVICLGIPLDQSHYHLIKQMWISVATSCSNDDSK